MDIKLAINASGNISAPELELEGGKSGLLFLCNKLKIYTSELDLQLAQKANQFYPRQIRRLICRKILSTNRLLNLRCEEDSFIVEGDEIALSNFADTLKNLAESETDYHFHLDYYEDNGIVSKTNISLVLSLKIDFDG